VIRSVVVGTGSAVPGKILTNKELESLVETSDEWISTRSGIRQRYIVSNGESTSSLATEAARAALEMAGVKPDELDMIVVGTTTPDYPLPNTAALVQRNLEARSAFTFDVYAACSGFLYGITIADKFIKEKHDRKILVIGAEVLSSITNWKDRSTCVLFGDAAGAAVVTGGGGGNRGILSTHLHSDGNLWQLLYIPGGGCLNPLTPEMLTQGEHCVHMQGNEVFKHAIRALTEVAREALEANKISPEEIDLFIPHQANVRIIKMVAERLQIPMERVYVNIDRYGNTSAASIPVALDEVNRSGRLKGGDVVLLDAFGAGFTWGAVIMRW
jgi:3-oxoacyl-[acyl-carrier-protein] synthase-3